MAYIPEKHKKYNLLRECVELNVEPIYYPIDHDLLNDEQLESLLSDDEYIEPIGDFDFSYYRKYEDYLAKLLWD